MGIYDREYIKDGQRGAGGFSRGGPAGVGRLRMLSVTAWLIIINVLVMVVQMGLASAGWPVHISNEFLPGVDRSRLGQLATSDEFFAYSTSPLSMQPVREPDTRAVGNALLRPLVEVRPDGSRQVVGRAVYVVMDPLEALGHFSTAKGFAELQVWRLVCFQFLHSGLAHIFFNMFGLFIFGPMVEQQLGGKRFLAFYLVCGIFGGLMYLLLNLIGFVGIPMPGALKTEIWTPLVGASAGVFGVLMACAYIAPKAIVRLLFPPISLEMRWLVYGYFALALWNLIAAGRNQGGDAAHVGGALAGFYFIRRPWLLRDFFEVFANSGKRPGQPRRRAGGGGPDRDIDRILDKISEKGMQSLSGRERKALEQHSRRHGNGD